MQVKIGGFAAFMITCVIVTGIVSCVEAVCNRPQRPKAGKSED